MHNNLHGNGGIFSRIFRSKTLKISFNLVQCCALINAATVTRNAATSGGDGCSADILFVVDSTGSVSDDYNRHIEYVASIVSQLTQNPGRLQVGVVLYSSRLRRKLHIPLQFHQDPQKLLKDIASLPFYSGITATGAGLELAIEALRDRRPGVPAQIVVITDGYSFDSVQRPAQLLKSQPGVTVYAVGVAQPIRESELLEIASSADHVLTDMSSANELARRLVSCGGPVVNPHANFVFTQPTPLPYGDQMTTDRPDQLPNAIAIEPPAFARTGGCVLDIMLIVDASGSVEERFERQLHLCNQLIDKLSVGEGAARVALVKYAGRGKERLVFDFDKHRSRDELKRAISAVRWMSGTTCTNDALLLADRELTSHARHGIADPSVIIFTDGYSQQDPAPANKLHARGVPVFAVGIVGNYAVNIKELEVIAGSASRVFTEETIGNFEAKLNELTRNCRT